LVGLCIEKVLDKLLPIARMDASRERPDYSAAIVEFLLSHDFFLTLKGTRACSRQTFSDEVRACVISNNNLVIYETLTGGRTPAEAFGG
jgi:hypothetical protein